MIEYMILRALSSIFQIQNIIIIRDTLCQMINYSYLSPPHKALTPPQKSFIFEKEKPPSNKPVRRIFKNVPYQQFEIEAINKLKEYLKSKEPNTKYEDDLLLRISYLASFNQFNSVEIIKKYCSFHHNDLYTQLTQASRHILQSGAIYSYGRDYEYHPLIFIIPAKIDLKKYELVDYLNAAEKLLRALEENMLVGGIIEKWNIIIDFGGKKVTIDKITIDQAIDLMSSAYPFRLKKLFFVNGNALQPPQTLIALNPISLPAQSLSQHLPAAQLQKCYGGSLANLVEYWPIHSTNKHEQESVLQMHEEKDGTQYESVLNDAKYFEDTGDKGAICDLTGSKCSIF